MPEVIGIYDEPPPAGSEDYIKTVRVANIGAIPLLLRATRLRDRLWDAVSSLIP